ncbi:MAG: tyrosine-protein phosphatase [Acidimicrobiales bacterium]
MTIELEPRDRSGHNARHVTMERLFNVRDLGGYQTADGRTTRWRTLYRADGIHHASEGDVERLLGLGLRTVLDLRTHGELEQRGRFAADHVTLAYHHLPVLRETWDGWVDVAPDVDAVPFLAQRYEEMLDDGAAALAGALEVLAEAEAYPAVFHCAAGKDRTGVLAAVVLGLLGVDDDTITTDYGLSKAAMDSLVEWMRANVPESLDAMTDQPAAFLDAPPRAMQQVLEVVRSRYGSMAGYVEAIGVDREVVAGLRRNLLT